MKGPIDLAATLRGGQAFRWTREADTYNGAIGRRAVKLEQVGNDIKIEGIDEPTLRDYFRIEKEDTARRARLALDARVPAIPGLRLLRQDPWETTIAFVTSANNNVPRIEGILRRIAANWGDEIAPGIQSFPSQPTLARARESSLRAIGLGYRAPFVRDLAREAPDLTDLRGRPLAEIREVLLSLPGVGPKVADCIALFSLDADDAFPIDRWVLRAMSHTFFGGREVKAREVEDFARERWGRDAGLAQQFLFHQARTTQETYPKAPSLS